MKFYYVLFALCGLPPGISFAQSSSSTEPAQATEVKLLPPVSNVGLSQPKSVDEPLPEPHADGLTLSNLEALALSNSPALSVYRARVEALQGERIQVGLPPNPVAGYVGSQIGDQGTAGQQGAYVGQEFVTGGKLRLNRAVASQDIRVMEQEYAIARYRVLNDVRLTYFDVLVSQRRIEVVQKLLEISERGEGTADLALKNSQGNRVDLLQSRVEARSARILLENSKNDKTAAWRSLSAIVGVSDLKESPIAGDLNAKLPEIEFDQTFEGLKAESPEVAAAQIRVDRARLALQRAFAERKPNVEVQASVQHDNATEDEIAGIQAGIPLPFWNRNQGGIRHAQAEVVAAESDVSRVEQSLKRRLAKAFQRYENAKQQVKSYELDILPDAKASLDLVTAGYTAGEFGYFILLTSQRTYFQTNLAYLESLRELNRERAIIDGLLLTTSLGDSE